MSKMTEHAAMAYGQLAGLLKSGMPLPDALRTLAGDARSARLTAALDRVADEMERGKSAEEAFRGEEKALGGMLARVAASASARGKLPELLSELSRWTLAQDRIRREFREALSYPLLVMFFASGLFLVAKLNGVGAVGMLDEMDIGGIPLGVKIRSAIVLTLSVSGVALPFVVLVLKTLAGCSTAVRRTVEELCIRMPVLRTVCRPLALTRFCSSVALLMKAGVPYHEAVAAAGPLSGFWPYELAAKRAAELLEKGESQGEAWQRIGLFPASLRFMTRCGAERGDVPKSFEELARLYETEAAGRAHLIALLAPPVCLLLLGIMALLMVWSLLWPLIATLERLGA